MEVSGFSGFICIPNEVSVYVYVLCPDEAKDAIEAFAEKEGFCCQTKVDHRRMLYQELTQLKGQDCRVVGWSVEQICRRYGITNFVIKVCEGETYRDINTLVGYEPPYRFLQLEHPDYWIREDKLPSREAVNLTLGSSYAGNQHIAVYNVPIHLHDIVCRRLMKACPLIDKCIDGFDFNYTGKDVSGLMTIDGHTLIVEFIESTPIIHSIFESA